MSIKPENTFRNSVHRHLPGEEEKLLYHMKTNNPYLAGPPDDWYSGAFDDLWIEYKFLPRIPVRVPVKVALSPIQRLWLNERHAEGRNIAVIVGCADGGVIYLSRAWDVEFSPEVYRSKLLSRKQLAAWIMSRTVTGKGADEFPVLYGQGHKSGVLDSNNGCTNLSTIV